MDRSGAEGGLARLAVMSLVVGALTGLVASAFRLLLDAADGYRTSFIAWAHGMGAAGWLAVAGATAVAAAVAAWMVRRYSPHASGSGIPHVEAVLKGELPPAPPGLAVVKFIGGLLAIGSGLVLGREGPSVQMGSAIGVGFSRVLRLKWPDMRVLLAAGAGAGLATAFNAPIAAAVFVLEEVTQKFEHRIAFATLGATAGAMAVAHVLLGPAPEFTVAAMNPGSTAMWPLFILMGLAAGLAAVVYNMAILGSLAAADGLKQAPVEVRAAAIGLLVGTVAWFAPALVGGGGNLTQQVLAGGQALAVIPLIFLLRFGLGALSYAARTPGGLFAPVLVLGAQIGFVAGALFHMALPGLEVSPEAFAVTGMAAFFAGVVRAPLTGILLIVEMTGSSSLLLPMIVACFSAVAVPMLLGRKPIYESLGELTRK